jgi:hypothetical protein
MSAIGTGSHVSSLRDLAEAHCRVRRLRFALPTVNKVLSLRDLADSAQRISSVYLRPIGFGIFVGLAAYSDQPKAAVRF